MRSKNYVSPLVDVMAFEDSNDVLTYSKENYVDWNGKNWFGNDDGSEGGQF